MTVQQILEVSTRGRSTTEITAEIAQIVRTAQVATGLANVFVLHTSCSVILTENADPTVRRDLETLAARWAPDGDSAYRHDDEGDDDRDRADEDREDDGEAEDNGEGEDRPQRRHARDGFDQVSGVRLGCGCLA